MKKFIPLFLLFNFLVSGLAFADQYDKDRHQMKEMLNGIVKDLNDANLKDFDQYLMPDSVVTFYDGRHAVGAQAINEYMAKMLTGKNPILKSIKTIAEETQEAKVYPNNTAVAFGTVKNDLVFVGGKAMHVDGRWSTTLIKQDNSWKIASLHFSTNIFDNALLNEAKKQLWTFAGIGVFIGFILGWLFKRPRKSV